MDLMLTRRQLLAFAATTAIGLNACGSTDNAGDTQAAADTDDVTQLTVKPGTLTVATGNPAYEPWVINDDPESGEGFEAALIYALADRLGFDAQDVEWVRTDFVEAFAPGDHNWDLNIQQVSINEDRKKAVDFSPAYFRASQAIAVKADSPYARATSLADFADATFAVCTGGTAYDYVVDLVKGGSTKGVDVRNDNADAAQAVSVGQADAFVTDVTEVTYMCEAGQIENGVVVGLIAGSEDPYGLGITLALDSPLTPAVTEAMNALIDDGTVEELEDTWLAAYTSDLPTLS
jgi:polar amino acid transport system substrate-binding protein